MLIDKKIKKILLIIPPTTLPVNTEYFGVGEPLGILYIAAVLEKNGYEVDIFDALCSDRITHNGKYITYGCNTEEISKEVKKRSPDIVGVSWFTPSNEIDVYNICKIVKKINEKILVVVGGTYPTLFPREVINHLFIDYVIIGEGEFRFLKLIESLNNKSNIRFDGIAYKKSKRIEINPLKHWIENLDGIPYPARHLIDFDKYEQINKKHKVKPFRKALVLATRGCFGKCHYCSVSKVWGHKIRSRSVKNIIGEIELLKNRYKIKEVYFVDDNICASKRFLKELFNALKKTDIRWDVPLGFYPDYLDKEIIEILSKSGIASVTLTTESVSERVLKEVIHKNVNIDRLGDIIKECHKHGVRVNGSFIVGLVRETREELIQTLSFAIRAGLDGLHINVALPIPGTDFYDECREKGYLPTEFKLGDVAMTECSVLKIPRHSPDFVMTPDELKDLISLVMRIHDFNRREGSVNKC